MSSSSCLEAGCPFSGGGKAGPCTATVGILSDIEIREVVAAGATVTLDPVAAVKIVTWDDNQWVSYDDAETMNLKQVSSNITFRPDKANYISQGRIRQQPLPWRVRIEFPV